MIARAFLAVMTALAAFTLGMAPALAAGPVNGRWITEDKDAIVTIQSCGNATCGTISRFLVSPPDGPGQRDIYNPDPVKKKRKLLGLPVLTQFKADKSQWRGRIYDPKTGKSYRSILRRKDANTLEVKGCIGPFCQTQIWKRAK
ncbi:DUF2147 domain-containing protein [Erythrobacter sp. F6033]|uniref:DUF2147 domain-containing protein n=1 Tax=Erythrobacter sp. F6033 TaxID=2926401 RepID=UPI001FF207E8|nr:DUF2147 domain-containing protein [Erythrobacter sp. F6033]MCK0129537.1 DUF2147 domain-containing protein [Erythrobacter sp. F6033]